MFILHFLFILSILIILRLNSVWKLQEILDILSFKNCMLLWVITVKCQLIVLLIYSQDACLYQNLRLNDSVNDITCPKNCKFVTFKSFYVDCIHFDDFETRYRYDLTYYYCTWHSHDFQILIKIIHKKVIIINTFQKQKINCQIIFFY